MSVDSERETWIESGRKRGRNRQRGEEEKREPDCTRRVVGNLSPQYGAPRGKSIEELNRGEEMEVCI